jgi:hypothetical protein
MDRQTEGLTTRSSEQRLATGPFLFFHVSSRQPLSLSLEPLGDYAHHAITTPHPARSSRHLRVRSAVDCLLHTPAQPGMSVADLVRFAGQPAKIVHPGERLGLASHHFQQASLDAHTVLYAYLKEGFPYYNVFVFVDTDKNVVSSCTIEKL